MHVGIAALLTIILSVATIASYVMICSEYSDVYAPLWFEIMQLWLGVAVFIGSFVFWAFIIGSIFTITKD
jgi:hypothetical protein